GPRDGGGMGRLGREGSGRQDLRRAHPLVVPRGRAGPDRGRLVAGDARGNGPERARGARLSPRSATSGTPSGVPPPRRARAGSPVGGARTRSRGSRRAPPARSRRPARRRGTSVPNAGS